MSNKPQVQFHDVTSPQCSRRVRILPSQKHEKRFQINDSRKCYVCQPFTPTTAEEKLLTDIFAEPKKTRIRRRSTRA